MNAFDQGVCTIGTQGAEEQVVGDLLERLAVAQDSTTAMARFSQVAADAGLTTVIYGYSPSARAIDGGWTVPTILTDNVPVDWDVEVRGVRWADPYYHACFGQTLAVDWHEVQRDRGLSADQRRFLKGVANYNMTQGMTIPVRLPQGAMTFLSFLGSEGDREFARTLRCRRSLLFLLAYNFLSTMHARFLQELTGPPPTTLGKRELECLRWSAQGKSSTDIGQILGISPETVRIHLKRAYAKLNASNRCNATAKAVQLGLLHVAM